MKQSRVMSLIETFGGTLLGFLMSLGIQSAICWWYGLPLTVAQNLGIIGIFTVASIARGYWWRRVCEALHIRVPLSPALIAVAGERRRQIEIEGFSPEHDDEHDAGELAYAGAAYLRHAADTVNPLEAEALQGPVGKLPPPAWPWEHGWWKPQDYRRNLIKGLALGLAELERFERRRKVRTKVAVR